MTAYYNEIDQDAAGILRRLIADDVIAPGEVDTRSIQEVSADDLRGFTQCHFFAGGGLWSVAARLAGWPDDRELWTGSCPCQPFSTAGNGLGFDDPRHLWPDFHRLIRARRPAVVMGEQVARKAGLDWFDRVRSDLASDGFASRPVVIPACAVDAPQIRERIYWAAIDMACAAGGVVACGRSGEARGAAKAHDGEGFEIPWAEPADVDDCGLGRSHGEGRQERQREAVQGTRRREEGRATGEPDRSLRSRNCSWWTDAEWLACHDGKARRAKPGLCLLVDGLPGRVGLWRVGGNAISPILAAEVIAAFLDSEAAA